MWKKCLVIWLISVAQIPLMAAIPVVLFDGGFGAGATVFEKRTRKAMSLAMAEAGFETVSRQKAQNDADFMEQVGKGTVKNAKVGLFVAGSVEGEALVVSLKMVGLEDGRILAAKGVRVTAESLEDLDGALSDFFQMGIGNLSGGTRPATGTKGRKPTVAVLDFEPVDVSKLEAVMIGDMVREELVRQGRFTVLERKNMNAILKEQSFQATGCSTEECRVQMGQLLNAEIVVSGQLVKSGETWQVTAKALDVATAKIVNAARVDVEDLAKAGPALEQLVTALAETPEVRLLKNQKRLESTRRSLVWSVVGTGAAGLAIVGFQLAGDDSLGTLRNLHGEYLNQTVTSQASLLGDQVDKGRQNTDTLFTLRDTAIIAAGVLLITDVILGLRIGALEKSLEGEQALKLTVRPTGQGLLIGATVEF